MKILNSVNFSQSLAIIDLPINHLAFKNMYLKTILLFISLNISLILKAEEPTTWTQVEKMPEDVKQMLVKNFKDPFSVKFRNLKVSNRGMYCGEVNAKNSYGAYIGFKKLYSSEVAADVAGNSGDAIIDIFCGTDD